MVNDLSAFRLHNGVVMRVVALFVVLMAVSGCGPAAADAGDVDGLGSTAQGLSESAPDGTSPTRGDNTVVKSSTSPSRAGGTVALPQDPIPWRATVINGIVTVEFDLPTDRVR